mmetsp:Transcript_46372/g.91976  ORF Transcript_46372/g.91976 Transcript_46372/m.91976 type:complete len:294 (-) Transcript_46372:263-1144(-)
MASEHQRTKRARFFWKDTSCTPTVQRECLWESVVACLGMPLAARVLAMVPGGLGLPARAANRSFATAMTAVLRENRVAACSLAWLCRGISVIRTWEMLLGTSGRASRMLLLRNRISDISLLLYHTGPDANSRLVPQVYLLKHQGVWYSEFFFISNGLHLPPPRLRHWLQLADASRTDAWLNTFRAQPPAKANFWARLRWRLGAPLWRVTFTSAPFHAFTSIGRWTVRPEVHAAGTGIVLTSAIAKIVLLTSGLLIIPRVLAFRNGGLNVPMDAAISALDVEACRAWGVHMGGA